MKKRMLSLLLALAMLCTLLPQAALPASAATYSGTCGGEGDGSNLHWTLDTATGLLTITGSGAMWTKTQEAPWYAYHDSITALSLPSGLTSIAVAAFSDCASLASVTIPNGVTKIGNGAFAHCWSLTSVSIPDSVTSIGNFAFEDCITLPSVSIPGSVKTISDRAF